MKLNFNENRDIWGPLLTGYLQEWGKNVLVPASQLIKNGKLHLPFEGTKPKILHLCDLSLPTSRKGLHFEIWADEEDTTLEASFFDLVADEYQMAVHPYKAPILERVLDIIEPLLSSDIRILDCGCGPGFESITLARIVIDSEVIGIDLSRDMIKNCYRNACEQEISNVSFYQCDAMDIQHPWESSFDLVFCQLSCSYFANMRTIAQNHFWLLPPGGIVILVEPAPSISNAWSMRMHSSAISLFKGYYHKDLLKHYYKSAGFSSFYWEEILPEINLFIFSK